MDVKEILEFKCYICQVIKPRSEFHINRTRPRGLTSACKLCGRKSSSLWSKMHPKEANAKNKRQSVKRRDLIIDSLGAKCSCCGEQERRFLTLEHLNGGGKAHRLRVGNTQQVYKDVIESNFDRTLYDLLCLNCNFAKRFGPCPHQKK